MCGVSNHFMRVPAERQLRAIGERVRCAVREIADGHHRRHLAAHRHGLRRGGQKQVQRAAFIGFEVRQAEVAQLFQRHHRANGLGDDRKQLPLAGVKQHRRVIHDEVLVEAELPGARNAHGRVDSEDAVRHFLDVGAGLSVGDHGDSAVGSQEV